jgi:hypothetical protein
MTEKTPPSRPALRRSVDATVHPALAGRSAPVPTRGDTADTAAPAPRSRPQQSAKNRRPTTSDVLRPTKKDPPVKVTAVMPKSVRKRLRKAAEQRGLSVEDFAAQLIAEGLDAG